MFSLSQTWCHHLRWCHHLSIWHLVSRREAQGRPLHSSTSEGVETKEPSHQGCLTGDLEEDVLAHCPQPGASRGILSVSLSLSFSLSLSQSLSLSIHLCLFPLSLHPAPTKSWKARPGSGLLRVGNQDPATLHHDLELVRIQAACSFNRHCLSTCCVSGPGLALGAQTGCPRWWKPEEGMEKKQTCVGCPLGSGTVVMLSTFGLIPAPACEVFTYLNRFHQVYQLKAYF